MPDAPPLPPARPAPRPAFRPERILVTVSDAGAEPEKQRAMSMLVDGSDLRDGGPPVSTAQVSSLSGRIVYSKQTVAQTHTDLCGGRICGIAWDIASGIATAGRDGSGATMLTQGGYDTAPSFSPDGSWIAFQRHASDREGRIFDTVAIMGADGGGVTVLPPPAPFGSWVQPTWSPDGHTLAVERLTNGQGAIVLIAFDGLVPVRTVVSGDYTPSSWSHDGTRLALIRGGQVWVVSVAGGAPRQVTRLVPPVVPGGYYCGSTIGYVPVVKDAQWSPDDRTIAFVANHRHVEQMNLTDVYTVGVDGSGLRVVEAAEVPRCVRGVLSPLHPLDVTGWSGGAAPSPGGALEPS